MNYKKIEIHDFNCRLCGIRWLSYTKNNVPCSSSLLEDGVHNFDFKKPIKIDISEKQFSKPEVQEGKITFQ
ncbi:MAG: hypothetical protein M3530_11625 [Thermoproteota archaeon]|nr:hypothetical protein [Thermoproteota archaeon]